LQLNQIMLHLVGFQSFLCTSTCNNVFHSVLYQSIQIRHSEYGIFQKNFDPYLEGGYHEQKDMILSSFQKFLLLKDNLTQDKIFCTFDKSFKWSFYHIMINRIIEFTNIRFSYP
jgi:hypothetical protein